MSNQLTESERQRVAALTLALYERRVTVDAFIEELGDVADPQVNELVDLLRHEPERGGMHGVGDDEYEAYRERLMKLVGLLSDY
jgi:hypothetical protein